MRNHRSARHKPRVTKRAVGAYLRSVATTAEQLARIDADYGVATPKRERAAPSGPTEHQEQVAVIQWWSQARHKWKAPACALFAIPNGGARDVITGARLKAEGVRRGVPDLMLAYPTPTHSGLFIEMKVGSNKPSPEQKDVIEYLNGIGYKAVTHWSADSAIGEIEDYLRESTFSLTMLSGAPE